MQRARYVREGYWSDEVLWDWLTPVPDAVLGERACCLAVLKSAMTLDLDGVCAYLQERGINKIQWPKRLVAVTAMPLTPTRKIIKSALVRQSLDQPATREGTA